MNRKTFLRIHRITLSSIDPFLYVRNTPQDRKDMAHRSFLSYNSRSINLHEEAKVSHWELIHRASRTMIGISWNRFHSNDPLTLPFSTVARVVHQRRNFPIWNAICFAGVENQY